MIRIRKAAPPDTMTIAEFNQAMALETENRHLEGDTIQSGVARMIHDEDAGFYLVALIEDGKSNEEIAGCLGITSEWSDWRNGLFWWIQSVYVSPLHRNRGVFSSLYQHVKDLAVEEADVCGIRLYADKENQNAISTYLGLGMMETDYRLLEVEF
jgi:GNAT superfamily N-acetyltransferase